MLLNRSEGALYAAEGGTGCLRAIRPGRKRSFHGKVLFVYAQVMRHAEIEMLEGACDGTCVKAINDATEI